MNTAQNELTVRGDCDVCVEVKPEESYANQLCEGTPSSLDSKTQLPGYSPPSREVSIDEESPPKYDSATSLEPSLCDAVWNAVHTSLCFWLKILAIFLMVLHTRDLINVLSPAAPADWARSHSRDFQIFNGEDEDWTRSGLGKLGPFSALLTIAEIELISEMEWEVEPVLSLKEDDVSAYESSEQQDLSPGTSESKLPLPFYRPSHLLNYSRQLFDQGKTYLSKHAPSEPDSLPLGEPTRQFPIS